MLSFKPVGGSAGAVTEFGLGTSEARRKPIFNGLPEHPQPDGEVKIGFVPAGSELHFYIKSDWGQVRWAFSHDSKSEVAREAFYDRDNSLERDGSAVVRTGPSTWVLHLDDATSGDDDDDDILIEMRLVPAKPPVKP
jgi:hypothetical protein